MKNIKTYKRLFGNTITVFSFLLIAGVSLAQPVITLTQEVSGLTDPVQVVNAGDGSDRVFVVEQGGAIKMFSSDFLSSSTFFTVPNVLNSGEQGLLSLAFDPDYGTNGYFYVFFVTSVSGVGFAVGDLRVVRYTNATPASNTTIGGVVLPILAIPHPTNTNHNGGEMHFGSDGNLYLSVGDGAVSTNAQLTTVLLGKILRINVSGATSANPYAIPSGNPYGNEIYARGLRNPFRWSFDSENGDMWIGDVGQNSWEELNFTPSASTLGANYGWHCFEGDVPYSSTGCVGGTTYITPEFVYEIPSGVPRSVIGGVVYRGANPSMEAFQGYYVGADFFSGELHIIGPEGAGRQVYTQSSSWTNLADFGETEDGEILAIGRGGFIYSLTADVEPLPVSIVDFNGIYNGEGVQLRWETFFEDNFLQFDVEMSDNAKNFVKIGTVAAKQSSNGSKYQFYHRKTTGGLVYYRLKMIDKDGTFANSKMIAINLSDDQVAGFVRPSMIKDGQLNLFLEESYNSVQLISLTGYTVFEHDIRNRNGAVEIPINAVTSGLYIVRLEGTNKVNHQKIVVLQ